MKHYKLLVGALKKFGNIKISDTMGIKLCDNEYVGCYRHVNFVWKTTTVQSVTECISECMTMSSPVQTALLYKNCYDVAEPGFECLEISAYYMKCLTLGFIRDHMCYVQKVVSCLCVIKTLGRLPSRKCNILCPDGLSCGGRLAYSVYTGNELKCEGTIAGVTMEGWITSTLYFTLATIVENCAAMCRNTSPFFIMTGTNCSCFVPTNTIRSENIVRTSKYCSLYNGLLTLHTTIHVLKRNFKNHFPDETIDFERAHTCQPGWKGDLCDKRDCSLNNGGCGTTDICVSSKVNGAEISECLCQDGYVKDFLDKCEKFRFNVAYTKPCVSCMNNSITNGVYLEEPLKSMFVSLDLLYKYFIAYVVVFMAEGNSTSNTHSIELHASYPGRNRPSMINSPQMCGSFIASISEYLLPIRVNCQDPKLETRFITVSTLQLLKMHFVEIEAYPRDCSWNNGNCGHFKCMESVLNSEPPILLQFFLVDCSWMDVDCGYPECLEVTAAGHPPYLLCLDWNNEEFPVAANVTESVSCRNRNGGCLKLTCIEFREENQGWNVTIKCVPPDSKLSVVTEGKPKNKIDFKGCFLSMHRTKELQTTSFETCRDFCLYTLVFGVIRGELCACGNIVQNEVSADVCVRKCSNGFSCGGNYSYSVYARSADTTVDIGCFKLVVFEHQLNQPLGKFSCWKKCKELEYPYGGLNGETCFCGEKIKFKDQVNMEQCDESTDLTLLADVSPEIDVYEKTIKYHFCLNDRTEMSKKYCKSGVCVPGWKGVLCNNRDCDSNNGSCNHTMICQLENVNYKVFAKCLCEQGFSKTDQYVCVETISADKTPEIFYNLIAVCSLSFIVAVPIFIAMVQAVRQVAKGNIGKYIWVKVFLTIIEIKIISIKFSAIFSQTCEKNMFVNE
ncbi:hypothetical protein HELRODRAFT_177759 [Helobdella robusta]|uniref:WSC domain-containing protein n=1 Tax=Helobdella robusta TaxID=6412 RepID=T1FC74_HELRO|nr:hypothetical protein HELRODRAFT_177759 [Helobdella robusta]ESN97701.1 hypothetical protein HELRODRAFT_177759 [Helobdella robusta]